MKKEMFGHEIRILRDTFRRLLRRKARSNLTKLIEKTHPADLAIIFRHLNGFEQSFLFSLMDENEQTAEFLGELDEAILSEILQDIPPGRIAHIIRIASSNDQAFILNILPEEQSNAVIELLHTEEREEIAEILAYPEDSAGSLMSTDVFTLHEDIDAGEALSDLQNQSAAEMVFYLYIADNDDRLVGVISLRDLATTPPRTKLKDIMIKNVQYVRPETDQEEVAKIVSQYNLLAVPVVDNDNYILGIVTVDDVVDVIREEATEDFLQMAGVGKDREILMKSSWGNAKSRIPWLFASFIGGVCAISVIGYFSDMLETIIALTAFIPIIIGMGGNIGTQSSTIIVRGLATGRVDIGSDLKLILKEVSVGIILGILYGILLGFLTLFVFKDAPSNLGLVVGISICASMIIATSIGTIVPLLLRRLDIDPAIATGPFVTTTIDILGVTLYFVIAALLLPL
jgi:magnesium transporter